MRTGYQLGGGLLLTVLAAGAPCAGAATAKVRPVRDAGWARAFATPGTPTRGVTLGRENMLNRNSRLAALLKASFPQKQWFWYDHDHFTPLPSLVHIFIGVPGDAILDDNRYVTADGCVPHDCVANRGMLWIDTGTQPAFLMFAAINPIRSNNPPFESHLWIYTSRKLSWQPMPAPFLFSLHRWLAATGEPGYRETDGYHYSFSIETIVQPDGVMVDLGPDVLGLSAVSAQHGAGL